MSRTHSKVKELMNSQKFTDNQLFTSKAFCNHLNDMVKSITKRWDAKRQTKVITYYDETPGAFAAFTNNNAIIINAGNNLAKGGDRKSSYKRILGLLCHETGHLLWTDFLLLQSADRALYSYRWIGDPVEPELKSNEVAFWDFAKSSDGARSLITRQVMQIQNIIEDGYIEDKMMHRFPGTLSIGLRSVRKADWDSFPDLDVMIEEEKTDENASALYTLLQILLEYVKYGEIKGLANVPNDEEHIEVLKQMIPICDEALQSNPFNRFVCCEKIALILFPYLQDYIQKYLDKQAQNNQQNGNSGGNAAGQSGGNAAGQGGGNGQLTSEQASEIEKALNNNHILGDSQEGSIPNSTGLANNTDEENGTSSYAPNSKRRNKTKSKLNMPQVSSQKSKSSSKDEDEVSGNNSQGSNPSTPTDSDDESDSQGSTGGESASTGNNSTIPGNTDDEDGEENAKSTASGDENDSESEETSLCGSEEDDDEDDDENTANGSSDEENAAENGSEVETTGNDNSENDDSVDIGSPDFGVGGIEKSNNGSNSARFEETDGEAEDLGDDGTIEEEDINDAAFDTNIESSLEQLLNKVSEDTAVTQLEKQRTRELNDFAASLDLKGVHSGIKIKVHRITEVTDDLKESYEYISPPLLAIAKRLAKGYLQIADDARTGGRLNGLMMGRHFDASSAYRNDGKVFVKNIMPQDMQELAVGLLLDESGSMDGERCAAAMATAIVLESFCSQLNIPIAIYGHTGWEDVDLLCYSDFEKYSNEDKYRLMNISARQSNRDGCALRFVAERLIRRPEDAKLLILVSDGQPNALGYSGSKAKADLCEIKAEYEKKGVCFCAAAIGEDKNVIHDIYGDAFLDVSDLNQLPKKLIKVLGKYLHTV